MKTKMKTWFFLPTTIFLCLASLFGAETESFFPEAFEEALSETTSLNSMMFSLPLATCGEEPLFAKEGEEGFDYRLVWIRTLDREKFIIRIHIREDERSGEILVKRLLEPDGEKWEERRVLLGQTACKNLMKLLAALWVSNPTLKGDGGLDGSGWCLEGRAGGEYRVLARASPFSLYNPLESVLEEDEQPPQNRDELGQEEVSLRLALLFIILAGGLSEEDIY